MQNGMMGPVRRHWVVYTPFLGYPVLWILGLSFLWPLLILPLAVLLPSPVRVPRGFGVWLLFLGWMLASAIMLNDPEKTLAFLFRASLYGSATVLFLLVFNARPSSLPVSVVLRALLGLWAVSVVLGFLGVFFEGKLTSPPGKMLMPESLLKVGFVQDITTPRLAWVGHTLGSPALRPSGPFWEPNHWASNVAILTPLVIAGLPLLRSAVWRRAGWTLLGISAVPFVYSLSRAAWVSLAIALGYGAVRMAAARGRALIRLVVVVLVLGGIVLVSPLRELISERIENPHSDEGRLALGIAAVDLVRESPILGHGSTVSDVVRGLPSVGTHGQLQLVAVSHGLVGLALFLWWFLMLTHRVASAPTFGLWIQLALLTGLLQTPFYQLWPTHLAVMMTAGALGLRELHGPVRHETSPPQPVQAMTGARVA